MWIFYYTHTRNTLRAPYHTQWMCASSFHARKVSRSPMVGCTSSIHGKTPQDIAVMDASGKLVFMSPALLTAAYPVITAGKLQTSDFAMLGLMNRPMQRYEKKKKSCEHATTKAFGERNTRRPFML